MSEYHRTPSGIALKTHPGSIADIQRLFAKTNGSSGALILIATVFFLGGTDVMQRYICTRQLYPRVRLILQTEGACTRSCAVDVFAQCISHLTRSLRDDD